MIFYNTVDKNIIATIYYCDNYRYRDSWKSDNFIKEAIKKEAKN